MLKKLFSVSKLVPFIKLDMGGYCMQTAPESGGLDSQDDAIEMNQATRYSQSISPLCKLNISNSQTNMIYHESSCL